MSIMSEMTPFGKAPEEIFDWNVRDAVRRASLRVETEENGLSIAELSGSKDEIRLGCGEYFGGAVATRSSGAPLVISGDAGKTIIKTPISVGSNRQGLQTVYISNVTFEMQADGRPVLDVGSQARVIVSGCIFRADKRVSGVTISKLKKGLLSITSCMFYGGHPSARLISNAAILGELVIVASYRDYGQGWTAAPFVGLGNLN
tara:strand:- start:74 stop:682 length:609 start_codon:yes stop_codon:yes gene_type:complete